MATGSNQQPAPLIDFIQYASSPGLRVYSYAELSVSSLVCTAVPETITKSGSNRNYKLLYNDAVVLMLSIRFLFDAISFYVE